MSVVCAPRPRTRKTLSQESVGDGGVVTRWPRSRPAEAGEAATVGHSQPVPLQPSTAAETDVVIQVIQHLDPGEEDAVVRS